MAAFARRDGFEVDVAMFEEWDAAGRTFDVVVARQTWHWVDPVAGAFAAAVDPPGGRRERRHGGYVRLTPAQLEEVLAGVGAAIGEAALVVPRVHYTTVVVTAVRSTT